MPYELKRVGKRHYEVINKDTGKIHAKHSTLKNAKAQIRLLEGVDHGMVLKGSGPKRPPKLDTSSTSHSKSEFEIFAKANIDLLSNEEQKKQLNEELKKLIEDGITPVIQQEFMKKLQRLQRIERGEEVGWDGTGIPKIIKDSFKMSSGPASDELRKDVKEFIKGTRKAFQDPENYGRDKEGKIADFRTPKEQSFKTHANRLLDELEVDVENPDYTVNKLKRKENLIKRYYKNWNVENDSSNAHKIGRVVGHTFSMFSGLGTLTIHHSKGGSLKAHELKNLLKSSYSGQDTDGFVLDKSLSSKTSKVFHNPTTGQTVVAHRGTKGLLDWINNGIYALGGVDAYKQTPRFKQAQRVQEQAQRKYGADKITTIGHSQGGLQSELLGKNSKEIITLNKATRPFSNTKNANQTDIQSSNDLVSHLNPFEAKNKKEIVIPSHTSNIKKEHNIDVLDRIDPETNIGNGLQHFERWMEIDGHHYNFPLIKHIIHIKEPLIGGSYRLQRNGEDAWDIVNIESGKIYGHALPEEQAKEILEKMIEHHNNESIKLLVQNEVKQKNENVNKILKKHPPKVKKTFGKKNIINNKNKMTEESKSIKTTWRQYWSNYCKGKKFGSRQAVNDAMKAAAKEYKSKK